MHAILYWIPFCFHHLFQLGTKAWQPLERLPKLSMEVLLSSFLDITTPPAQSLLGHLASLATNDSEKEKLTQLSHVSVKATRCSRLQFQVDFRMCLCQGHYTRIQKSYPPHQSNHFRSNRNNICSRTTSNLNKEQNFLTGFLIPRCHFYIVIMGSVDAVFWCGSGLQSQEI